MNSAEVSYMQFKPTIKGIWKVCMGLFSSWFYKYLTKYIKLVAQKKQLARILEILGKFRSFRLKSKDSVEK